jgi:predicted HAD superfamily Cof-like phosphohydrolase
VTTIRDQVLAFHRAGDIPVLDAPQVPDEDRVRLRARLVAEEFFELMTALYADAPVLVLIRLCGVAQRVDDFICNESPAPDLVKLADACADLDYVVEGTRLEFGIDGAPIADAVHASNMAKFGEGSRERADGKIEKPPGWKPPDIAALIREQKLAPMQQDARDAVREAKELGAQLDEISRQKARGVKR